MGENTMVDLAELHGLADRVAAAADDFAELRAPTLDDGLAGSAVVAAVAEQPVDDRIAEVVEAMRTWAAAARQSADALGQADRTNAGRFAVP